MEGRNVMTTAALQEAEKRAENEKRLATMRANLDKLETRANELMAKGDDMTAAERLELLHMVNIAFHKTGKIEGIFSVDGSVTCEFCQRMRAAALATEENILMICGSCYAAADEYKEASWRRHALNMRIMSTILFTVAELSTLYIGGLLCRLNEDGDIANETMGRNYIRLIRAHEMTRFGLWYKNAAAMSAALAAEGIACRADLPDNVRIIHSSVLIGFPVSANWYDDAIFTVYPDKATTETAIANGAHECNGRKCSACGFTCYLMARRQEVPLYIAEYLRCSKARRELIMKAYNARIAKIAG